MARMEEVRYVDKVLDRKPKGKRPLVRPSHKSEDIFKMDVKEIGY
jgi:hypothetical protein